MPDVHQATAQSSVSDAVQLTDTLADGKTSLDTPAVRATPLPWRQIIVLNLIVFCEPFTYVSLFPFVAFMVESLTDGVFVGGCPLSCFFSVLVQGFHIAATAEEVGYYAGIIASSFALAQFLSSFLWGTVSDRIGRRPVLLFGLVGNVGTSLLFGTSQTFAWAVCGRAAAGLLNGNISVVKTYLREITDASNQARAFSLLSFMWAAGSIVGSASGGFLSNLDRKYPHAFGPGSLPARFPYLPPMLAVALINAVGFVLGLLLLPETRAGTPRWLRCERCAPAPSYTEHVPDDDVETALAVELNTHRAGEQPSDALVDAAVVQTAIEQRGHGSGGGDDGPAAAASPAAPTGWVPSSSLLRNWPFLLVVADFALLRMLYAMGDELLPLWSMQDYRVGGLNFNSNHIGTVNMVSGVVTLVFQFALYAPLSKRFGALTLYRAAAVGCALLVPWVPFLPGLYWSRVPEMVWVLLIALWAARALCAAIAFTAVNLMQNNALHPHTLGRGNGAAQSASSLSAAFGPALCGAGFSWSLAAGLPYPLNAAFMWNVQAVVAVAGVIISLWLRPEHVNRPYNVASTAGPLK